MSSPRAGVREGSLEAPTRHPIDWKNESFYDEGSLFAELERVFDICHGCRRCVNLCRSFPTLFDLIDESESMEIDGVDRKDYWNVVEHCYLCDLCYLTKCPYVPPHEWNVDFPHLMLRAKATGYRKGRAKLRDRIITDTDRVGRFASLPVVVNAVNAANRSPALRRTLEVTAGISAEAPLPRYHRPDLRARLEGMKPRFDDAQAAGPTRGRVVLFSTCYINVNAPRIGEDLLSVFEHNRIAVRLPSNERCCGMPKLDLGDLEAVERAKDENVPELARLIDEGWDVVALIPSCVLMFKQELPLMFPDDPLVAKVRDSMFDPFEYLAHRHRAGLLRTDFHRPLGRVAWQVACHQRVQRIGPRTRDILSLVPETEIETIERCSGHDGTYAVKAETRAASMKIVRPIARQVERQEPDHVTSDCPMAGDHVAHASGERLFRHPMSLLREAYGI